MKIALLFLIGLWGGGCATSAQHLASSGAAPPSLMAVKRQCVAERAIQISREWSRYEFKRKVEVVFPNWRRAARAWARQECAYGRPIADFHPR